MAVGRYTATDPLRQGTTCQRQDWPTHRASCTPWSPEYEKRVIVHYMNKHRPRYLELALESLGFYREFYRTDDIQAMLARINARFLYVVLRRVQNPGRGMHNKVQFLTSTTRSINTLETANSLSRRLSEAFPAILIGFHISNRTVNNPLVNTITYSFDWTTLRTIAMGTRRVIEGITDAENELQEDGRDV